MAESTGAAGHGRSAALAMRRTASSHPGRVFLATVDHAPAGSGTRAGTIREMETIRQAPMGVRRDRSCRLERAARDAHPVSGDRARARSRRGRDDMRFPSSGWSAARGTALLSMLLVVPRPARRVRAAVRRWLSGRLRRGRPRAAAQCQPALPQGQGWRRDHRRGRRAPRRSAQDHDGDHGGPGRDPRRDPRGPPAVTVGAGRDGARGDLRAGDGVPGDRLPADGSPLPAAHRRSALAPLLGRLPVLHRARRGRRTWPP